MKFFKKSQVGNAVYDSEGNHAPFEPLSGEAGVIALQDDSPWVAILTKVAGSMGVSVIDAERYEDLKKKRPLTAYEPRLQRLNKGFEFQIFQAQPAPKLEPVPEVAARAVPVADLVSSVLRDKATATAEPPPDFKPRRGRPRKSPEPASV